MSGTITLWSVTGPLYSIAALIDGAEGLLGVESYVAAGALYGLSAPMDQPSALAQVEGWLGTTVPIAPTVPSFTPEHVLVDVAATPKGLNTTGVTQGQVLAYDAASGTFKPASFSSGGGGGGALASTSLTDSATLVRDSSSSPKGLNTTGITNGQSLTYDSTSGTFRPASLAGATTPNPSLRIQHAVGVPLAGRAFSPGNNGGGGSTALHKYNTALVFQAKFATLGVTLAYGNWLQNPADSLANIGQLQVNATIEWPLGSGNLYECFTAGGGRVLTLNPGGMGVLAASVPLPSGTLFRVWTYAVPLAFGSVSNPVVPLNMAIATTPGDGMTHSTSDTDQTGSNTNGTTLLPSLYEGVYGPAVILGRTPTYRSIIAIDGDSISAGTGDSVDDTAGAHWGFLNRALAGFSTVQLGTPVEFLASITGYAGRLRRQQVQGLSDVVIEGGSNDVALDGAFGITNGTSLKTDVLNKVAWYGTLQPLPRIWVCTLVPRQDNGSFTNQANNLAVRADYNGWLRDGMPLAAGNPVAAGSTATPINTNVTARPGIALARPGNTLPGAPTQVTPIARCTVFSSARAVLSSASGPPHPVSGVFDPGHTVESGAVDSNIWVPAYNSGGDGAHPSALGAPIAAAAIPTQVFV